MALSSSSDPTLTVFNNISKWKCNKLLEVLTKKLTATIASHNIGDQTMAFGQESFLVIDTKKDDVLDEEEIANYLQSCDIPLDTAKQKARSLIQNISEDRTVITKNDWVHSHISNILSSEHVQKVQFDKIDTNQTGVITMDDLLSTFSEFEVTRMDLDLSLKDASHNDIKFADFQRAIKFEPAITFNDKEDTDEANTSNAGAMNSKLTIEFGDLVQADDAERTGLTTLDTVTDTSYDIRDNADDDDDNNGFTFPSFSFDCDSEIVAHLGLIGFLVIRIIPPILALVVLSEMKSIWSPFDDDAIKEQCNGEINAFLYTKTNGYSKDTKVHPDEYFETWMYYIICTMVFPVLCWAYYTYKLDDVWEGLYNPVKYSLMMGIGWMVFWSICVTLNTKVIDHCDASSAIYQGNEEAFGWILPIAILDLCFMSLIICAGCCLFAYYVFN